MSPPACVMDRVAPCPHQVSGWCLLRNLAAFAAAEEGTAEGREAAAACRRAILQAILQAGAVRALEGAARRHPQLRHDIAATVQELSGEAEEEDWEAEDVAEVAPPAPPPRALKLGSPPDHARRVSFAPGTV